MAAKLNFLFSYLLPKSFGLAPYWLKDKEYVFSYFGCIHSFIILVALIVFLVLSFIGRIAIPGDQFGTLTTILCSSVIILNVITNQKSAILAGNSIASVTASLKRFVTISYRNILIKVGLEFSASIILFSFITWFEYKGPDPVFVEWYSYMVLVVLFCIKTIFVSKFNWMGRVVKQMFDNLNILLEKESIHLSNDLTEIAVLHETLTRCSMDINSAYSLSLFFMACDSFVRLCFTSYTLIVCQLYSQLEACIIDTPLNAITFAWYVLQLWTVIAVCQAIIETATNTSVIIHTLLRTIDDKHPSAEKLELFSYQILQKLQFSACGFFNVDFTFLTMLVGLVTTYVIIFVQFRVVTETNKKVKVPEVSDIHKILADLSIFKP